jgi:hypothetical protein
MYEIWKNTGFWDVAQREMTRTSEKSVRKRATRRNIPEYSILHSHRRENLKS